MSLNSPWYLSAAAVREYLSIAGIPDDDDGPNWRRAERELADHARNSREVGPNGRTVLYRTNGKVPTGTRQRPTRLEFSVSFADRHEGELPQLIHVRDKGRGHRGGA